jgi:hypothetical protein
VGIVHWQKENKMNKHKDILDSIVAKTDETAVFNTVLHEVLNDMRDGDDNLCCAVYTDDNWNENAIVMFMEYDNYDNMHAVMQDLHSRLSDKLGYPVSICHNHPTDESVLIHSNVMDAREYIIEECCKQQSIERCINFLKNKKGYRPELHSIALGAEAYAGMYEKPVMAILMSLNWNKDPQAQIIRLLVQAYNNTQK